MNDEGGKSPAPTSDERFVDGVRYRSASEIAAIHGYVRDHVARLCRQGKVRGIRVSTTWYVDETSFLTYLRRYQMPSAANSDHTPSSENDLSPANTEQERATARESLPHAITVFPPNALHDHVSRMQIRTARRALVTKTFATATLALIFTIGTLALSAPDATHIVSVQAQSELAAAADPGGFLAGLGDGTASLARSFATRVDDFVFGIAPPGATLTYRAQTGVGGNILQKSTPTPRAATTTSTAASLPSSRIIVEQPIIRRIIEQLSTPSSAPLVSANLVTQDQLNNGFSQLGNSLRELVFQNMSAPNSLPSSGGYTNEIAAMQQINNLSNVTISNATVSGVSGLKASDIPALNYLPLSGAVGTANGGTGTSTAPTYGKLLVGNSGGGYDLLATSSLGIVGGGTPVGIDTQVQFNNSGAFGGDASFTFSTSTKQLSATNAVFTNATTTNATSTNFFATNASTTNATSTSLFSVLGHFTAGIIDTLSSAVATITSLTATNLIATNATTTNATSTNLAVIGTATSTFTGGITTARLSALGTSTLSGLVVDASGLRLSGSNCSTFGNGGKLTTDASGNVSCAADQGGSGSTVGGADTQIQFNNNGAFAGSSSFTFSSSTARLTITNASSTALTATNFFSTTASTTNLTISALQSGLLKVSSTGLVSLASAGTDYQVPLSFSYPILNTGNAISLAFGTTTSNTWTGTQTFANSSTTLATITSLWTPSFTSTIHSADANGKLQATTVSSPLSFSGSTLSINNAAADGSTRGAASFTAADFTSSAGNISLNYANGQKATPGQPGFLASADFTTFNNKLTALGSGWATTTGASVTFSTSTLSFNGLTLGQTVAAGAATLTFTPTLTGTLSNSGLTNSTIGATSPNSSLSFGSSAALGSTFTGDLNLGHSNWWTAAQNFANASTSQFTATSSVWFTGITSSLLLNDSTGKVGAYGGASCTNQFVRSLNGAGAATCATVQNADLANSSLTINTTYPFQGGATVSLGGSATLSLAFGTTTSNTWAGTQTFANTTNTGTLSVTGQTTLAQASTTLLSVLGPAYFGATATSSFATTGALSLATALTVGNGGTGAGTFASNGILYGNGTGALQALAINSSATNKFLTQVSSGAPAWNTIAAADLPGSFAGFANPSATIGLTAVNGSAATAMRSDAAPALSQSITPTWTGLHLFSGGASSTQLSVTTKAYFGGTATSTFDSAGNLSLVSNGLTVGTSQLVVSGGTVGIGTTSPGSILSVQGVANWTTSTSTFYSTGGINLTSGCFALGGSCLNTFLQVGSGAVARSVRDKLTDTLNVKDFGAICDGVTDDTTAITNAIAATPVGGTLVLPAATCLVSGSGSAIFTITNPINIVGQGMSTSGGGSIITVASSVPTTRDIFRITGVTNSTLRGFGFSGFSVEALSGSVGRDIFHFDTTAGTATNLAEIVINHVYMQNVASAGGYSIDVDNGTGTNTNGGTFNFIVENSYLGGGIKFVYAGDSLRVVNNIISTANAAVTLNQVTGAGNFLMTGNNVSGTGGGLVISQAVAPVIENNEFEQQATNTEANNSIIDLTGSVANISNAKITGNQVQANASVGNPTLVRVAAATGAVIDNNRFGTPAAYVPVILTAAASKTTIGAGNTWPGLGAANVTDSGQATQQPITQNVSTGNTGIGTSTPQSLLYINNSAGIGANTVTGALTLDAGYGAASAAQSIDFVINGNSNNKAARVVNPTNGSDGELAFYTTSNFANVVPTEKLRINGSGNVGIGTTTPYSRLTVWGPDSAASTTAFLVANNASTTEFAVLDNGNATLAGNLIQNSDQRLKTNIQSLDASSSVAAIEALNPVSYSWIEPTKGGIPQYGFIAQDVQKVFPNLVAITSPTPLTPDGTLSLNYNGFIAPLVAAVQNIIDRMNKFADSFTTKELTFTRATGDEINANTVKAHQLCVDDVCVTKDQLKAMLAGAAQPSTAGSGGNPTTSTPDTTPPTITINGSNPAHIPVGDSYADLGARIASPAADKDLGIRTFLNGKLVSDITIDTSAEGTDTIDYVATDAAGNTATSSRKVIVTVAALSANPSNSDSVASTTVLIPLSITLDGPTTSPIQSTQEPTTSSN